MPTLKELRQALHITRSLDIARRYLVTNGFDGTLAMIALGTSGIASAYISETAERRRGLTELQDAMLEELTDSAHGSAARWAPLLIALVNGMAPFLMAQLIMLPLWLAAAGTRTVLPPYDAAISIAFVLIFLLGIFLGRIGGYHWLAAGLRTTAIGLATAAIILLVDPG